MDREPLKLLQVCLTTMFERCAIRFLVHEDLPMVLAWRNHPNVRRFMLTQHEITLEEHRNWFAKVSQDVTHRLLIIEEAQLPIGYVHLSNITLGNAADWGFYTRPDSPKGNGRKLGFTALNYAFSELGLHKLCGYAIECNQASIVLHKRLGFKQEGILRAQQYINGTYHSLVCFGLLAQEWQPEKLIQEYTNA